MFVFKWWSNILIKERTLISSVFNKTGMWMGTVSLPYDQQNMFSVFCCTTQEAEFPAPRSFVEFLSCWFTPTQKKHLRFHDGFPPLAAAGETWRPPKCNMTLPPGRLWIPCDIWGDGIPGYRNAEILFIKYQVVVDFVMLETFSKGIFKEVLEEGKRIQDNCWLMMIYSFERWRMPMTNG